MKYEKTCELCGNAFDVKYKSLLTRRFCSRSCVAKWRLSQDDSYIHNRDVFARISATLTGSKFSDKRRENISNSLKGRTIPRDVAIKSGLSHRGSNHWNWKGGKSNYNKTVRGRIEFKFWRKTVFERDNYTCQKCGERGVNLNPHHIINFSEDENSRYLVDNGITFCRFCHYDFHKKFGYSKNSIDQIKQYLNERII